MGGSAEHPSIDSWSAGVVMSELITGRPLFPGRNVIDQLTLVYGHLGTPDETIWPSVQNLPDYGKLDFGSKPAKKFVDFLPRACESQGLVDLLSNLIVLNPEKRCTSKQGDQHRLWSWTKLSSRTPPGFEVVNRGPERTNHHTCRKGTHTEFPIHATT